MTYPRRPYTFDRVVRILFSVLAILGILYVLNLLKGVLLPFLVACLIAYTLEPVVKWNMKILHLRNRFVPVILTLLEFTAAVSTLAFILVPYIAAECEEMGVLLRRYASTTITTPYLPSEIHEFLRENLDVNSFTEIMSRDEWKDLIKQAISSSWSFLSSGLSLIIGLFSWIIVFLYVIFIMIDYEKLMLSFRQLVPQTHRRQVLGVFRDVRNAMNCYFRGQALIAAIVGLLFALGFWIVGLPMGVLLGLAIGVMNLVPYLQLISLPVTAVLCLVASVDGATDFWTIFWESMAVYVVVQCIQDLFLTPRIMGKAMGLNPAIILLSLSIWGCLLGFLGLIIALPLTTLILSYYDRFVVQPYVRHNDPDDKPKIPASTLDAPFD